MPDVATWFRMLVPPVHPHILKPSPPPPHSACPQHLPSGVLHIEPDEVGPTRRFGVAADMPVGAGVDMSLGELVEGVGRGIK